MKKPAFIVIVLATAAVADTQIPQDAQNVLTTIDQVPTKTQIDNAFMLGSNSPLQSLSTIAQDSLSMPTYDLGARLRAIHALTKYCAAPCADTDPAHTPLTQVIGTTSGEHVGYGVLVLRAAIEAIGPQQVQTDYLVLAQLLNHPSRDIRASAAHALRDLGNCNAVPDLRARYSVESTEQVKLAISDALRILGANCP